MRILVIGGGIAGVSIACELADSFDVTVLEAEKSLALHTTGRSAATWIGSYGPPNVRTFSEASLPWLLDPPIDVDGPLARDMECLWIGEAGHDDIARLCADTGIELLTGAEAEKFNPVLRPGVVEAAALDRAAKDLDVAGLHHAYVRELRARGGRVVTSARLAAAERGVSEAATWHVRTESGEEFEADVLVNAAGAWGDIVAERCGAAPIGLQPMRRSIFTSPTQADVSAIPFTAEFNGHFYFKAEGDTVLCSPQDATAEDPGDPKPDQLEIARTIEHINELTTLGLRSVRTSWAGQRTFTPEGEPRVAWDGRVDGFFWYVGQGGWGIQMAPALARHGASQIRRIA